MRPVTAAMVMIALVHAAGAETMPVSYTHLRAHETVLDLVCRLLLEKKKIKTHNHELHRERVNEL